MKRKVFSVLSILLLLGFVVSGCGAQGGGASSGEEPANKTDITIACAETTQDLVAAAVPVMAEKGYNLTYQLFDNNVNTLVAANDGSVDGVMVVHRPFMENFNASNDGDLVMAEPYIFAVGMGLYSERYQSIDQLPDGAEISIFNDSMNMDRGLRILEDAGLLSLDPAVDKATLLDITENPRNFQFVEMDQTQIVRSLEDMDAAIAFFSHMKNAYKDFTSWLVRDAHPENYPQGVVVKEGNINEPWVQDLVDSFRSDEVRAFAEEHYGGLYEYLD